MLLEIILATVLVSLVSLVGLVLLAFKKDTLDSIVFIILSFATGTLLATAFFDLLPEALDVGLPSQAILTTVLASILIFFILERLVHWHHEHDHHDHSDCEAHDPKKHEKPVGYLILIGDGLHNFFDGLAIAASFMVSPALGITTSIAIILHEIPHELGDFTLLTYSGFSVRKALAYNLLSALAAVAGGVLFFYLSGFVNGLTAYGLAFSAGSFIYIACTDLLPELHKEEARTKGLIQVVSILAGILLIWVMVNTLHV